MHNTTTRIPQSHHNTTHNITAMRSSLGISRIVALCTVPETFHPRRHDPAGRIAMQGAAISPRLLTGTATGTATGTGIPIDCTTYRRECCTVCTHCTKHTREVLGSSMLRPLSTPTDTGTDTDTTPISPPVPLFQKTGSQYNMPRAVPGLKRSVADALGRGSIRIFCTEVCTLVIQSNTGTMDIPPQSSPRQDPPETDETLSYRWNRRTCLGRRARNPAETSSSPRAVPIKASAGPPQPCRREIDTRDAIRYDPGRRSREREIRDGDVL